MAGVLDIEIAAEPPAVAHVRRAVSSWLGEACRSSSLCGTGYDLLLAVNEAVTNCVEHAYRHAAGVVAIHGSILVSCFDSTQDDRAEPRHCGGRLAHVEITDHGRWRPPPADPGFRGRGLSMIKALVDHMDLAHLEPGTRIALRQTLGRC